MKQKYKIQLIDMGLFQAWRVTNQDESVNLLYYNLGEIPSKYFGNTKIKVTQK